MVCKRLAGLFFIAIGIGIILSVLIPEEIFTFLTAMLCIVIGVLLVNC